VSKAVDESVFMTKVEEDEKEHINRQTSLLDPIMKML